MRQEVHLRIDLVEYEDGCQSWAVYETDVNGRDGRCIATEEVAPFDNLWDVTHAIQGVMVRHLRAKKF